jgi:hypothetical protein
MKLYKKNDDLWIDGEGCLIIKKREKAAFTTSSDINNVVICNFCFYGYDTFKSKIKLIFTVIKFLFRK